MQHPDLSQHQQNPGTPRTATIIGAGIGGLAAALCLARTGWQVQVLEQSDAFGDVGAGIQLSPNAMKVLGAIGHDLYAETVTGGVEPSGLELRDGISGRQIFDLALRRRASFDGKSRRWIDAYVNIYRPTLINALVQSVQRQPAISIALGQHVTLDQFDRLGRQCDLVVVANGLHSDIVQQRFYAQPPIPSGHIAYRAVVDEMDDGDVDSGVGGDVEGTIPTTSCGYVAQDRHAVTYYVRTPQGKAINFVGIVEAPADAIAALDKGWNTADAKDQALDAFAAFKGNVPQILHAAPLVRPWPLYHRAPLPTWHSRNAVLLGDAAHPMLPTFAQGAAMAIEDAWVLAQELAGPNTVNNALSRYTGYRLPRVSKVYEQAMRNLHLFHQKGAVNRAAGTLAPWVVGKVAPGLILRRFDAVYGHDVTATD